ncbi:hypothetical protein [Leucobacter sp. cx-169]|uniref:DUF7007 domain-containing protein n=1 Tax=Leucobacter sp. cx-169 TaxID=2770549 RepID=UPI00165E2A93|nr:hypothetical protein [Leucobacter sp. cx-169]MBC9927357.1 hypothetical protein [Leucobacter sp. cx-169]
MSTHRQAAGAVKAGNKIGGQYAAHERAGAAAPLAEGGHRDWGDTGIEVGSRTPWGPAQYVIQSGDGITVVGAEGHGGIKLSAERNREIPPALRRASGWYEEDCEAHIPSYFFSEELAHDNCDADRTHENSAEGIKQWYPDEWEKATGETVDPSESRVRREQILERRTQNQMVLSSATPADSDPTLVRVTARRKSDGVEGTFLVTAAEYKAARDNGDDPFIIDTSKHAQVPPERIHPGPEWNRKLELPSEQDLRSGAVGGLTAAASKRIDADLSQRWRNSDGEVRTLREILENDGADQRKVYVDQAGRSEYCVVQADGSSFKVSKATFDHLSRLPDRRKPSDIARQDVTKAEAKYDKLFASQSISDLNSAEARQKRADAQAEIKAHKERFAKLYAEELDADIAANGTWQEREAARKASNAVRESFAQVLPPNTTWVTGYTTPEKVQAEYQGRNTPSYPAAPPGRSAHIGGGVWESACSECDQKVRHVGSVPRHGSIGPHEVEAHGAKVGGINVGLLG